MVADKPELEEALVVGELELGGLVIAENPGVEGVLVAVELAKWSLINFSLINLQSSSFVIHWRRLHSSSFIWNFLNSGFKLYEPKIIFN